MIGGWDDLSPEHRAALELGDAAMQRLKRGESIERWHEVGIALNTLQAQAMTFAQSNTPAGAKYNAAWADLASHVPHLRDIDKSSRSHATWLAANWEPVSTWLLTLPP